MKLAFSTNANLKFSFAEAVKRLAKIGYAGVEIMADVPHAWPAFLLEEQKQAIRDALATNHLAISNVNAFMMHAVNDPRQRYWHPSWIEPDRHYRRRHPEIHRQDQIHPADSAQDWRVDGVNGRRLRQHLGLEVGGWLCPAFAPARVRTFACREEIRPGRERADVHSLYGRAHCP